MPTRRSLRVLLISHRARDGFRLSVSVADAPRCELVVHRVLPLSLREGVGVLGLVEALHRGHGDVVAGRRA